jgi:hypothetical protein
MLFQLIQGTKEERQRTELTNLKSAFVEMAI